MKRLLTVLLIGLLILGLVACGGDKKDDEQHKNETKETSAEQKKADEQQKAIDETQKNLVDAAKKKEEDKKATEEAIKKSQNKDPEEQIKAVIKNMLPNLGIKDAESGGEVHTVATYKNMTDMPITSYDVAATYTDTKETTYFLSSETVLPGATSPNFSSSGPASGKVEDIDINLLSITFKDSPNSLTTYDYDVKSGELTKNSPDVFQKSPVDVSKLIPELKVNPPDSIGEVYVEGELKNTTEFTITAYNLKYLIKDSNEISYLGFYETVLPGKTSSKFSSFGPKTGDLKDMELRAIDVQLQKEDGTTLSIKYDILLDYSHVN